jgi:hypothetical protein
MYRFKKSLIALTGVLTLVAIFTVAVPHIGRGASGTGNNAPTSQTQNVNVVNTPTINAQQSGTWNVGINGTPVVGLDAGNNTVKFDAVNNTVKVDPTNPLSVRDMDNPARQPFRKSVFVSLADGSTFNAINPGITPPVGKRLVIETISASGNVPSGQKFACSLNLTDEFAQPIFNLEMPLSLSGTFGPVDTFQGTTTTRMYVDPSDNVTFYAFRTAGTGAAGMRVNFSGYFVDVP